MSRSARAPVALVLGLGLAAYLGLHFLEPPLVLTWSYAHLGRTPALPWLGAALVLLLPIAARLAHDRPWWTEPLAPVSWRVAVLAGAASWLVLLVLGRAFPAPAVCIDVGYFLKSVDDGSGDCARWYLALRSFMVVAGWMRPLVGTASFIRGANALLAAVALVALAASARRLAATRGEAIAITLLAWSAFGTLQLTLGYIDVYPIALAFTALYLWTGLGALAGDIHPLWPALIAALGPFWYVGLVLLVPSYLVIVLETLRRPGGWGRLALAAAVGLAAAGAATVPGFGHPFAWAAFVARVVADSGYQLGLSPTSSLLPAWFIFSAAHAREVLHTLILIDGVGLLLLVVAGGGLLARGRSWDAPTVFLALVVLPYLTYVIAMDPLFGPFADWDLFSYGAAATSLLGGYAFVRWARSCPRIAAMLLGLALAAAGVHLLARLNTLNFDYQRHIAESPFHLDLK